MSVCMIAEQWHTTLSPPVRLRENRDTDHGGTVALIAVSNGGQSGRMRFFTHTPAFLFVSLSCVPMPPTLSRRMIKKPFRATLLRPVFCHTVAVRDHCSFRTPQLAESTLTGYFVTFHPETIPHSGSCSGHSNHRAAACTNVPARLAEGRPDAVRRRAFFPKMNFTRHPAGEAFVYINV